MKLRVLPCLLLCLLLLSGCTAQAEPVEATFFAMDTIMTLRVYGGDQALLDRLQGEVLRLEGLWSVTDGDSEIYAANHALGSPVTVSEDTAALIFQALELGQDTGGALALTIRPVVQAWGFTTGEYQIPSQEELDGLLPLVDDSRVELDGTSLTLPDGAELDLGAVAKGYTGQHLARLIREAGVTSALLDLGGNIQTVGCRPDGDPWRVAVRDPEGEGYAAVLEVEDEAVVTSGGYERYFEQDGKRYHHIIDPATGYPAESGLLQVTVVAGADAAREDDGNPAGTGTMCDAFSTALFVMGEEKALDFWRSGAYEFDLILVTDDGRVLVTDGLADRFTPMDGSEYSYETVS